MKKSKFGLFAVSMLIGVTAVGCSQNNNSSKPDNPENPDNPPVTYDISGVEATATMHVGATLTLNPTVEGLENVAFRLVSSDPSVVSVEGNVLTAVGEGTATVTITLDSAEEDLASLSTAVTVTVNGHKYTAEVVDDKYLKEAATCESNAIYYKSCPEDGTFGTETFEAEGTKLAHEWVEVVDEKYLKEAATCDSNAIYYKSCSHCGEAGEETFEAAGTQLTHEWVEVVDEKYLKEATTCDSNAIYYKSCSH